MRAAGKLQKECCFTITGPWTWEYSFDATEYMRDGTTGHYHGAESGSMIELDGTWYLTWTESCTYETHAYELHIAEAEDLDSADAFTEITSWDWSYVGTKNRWAAEVFLSGTDNFIMASNFDSGINFEAFKPLTEEVDSLTTCHF